MIKKSDIKFLKEAFKVEMGESNVCIHCDEETAKMIAKNTDLTHIGTMNGRSLFK